MAAFPAACANNNAMSATVARAARQSQGGSDEVAACESLDMGHNTIQEKTREFFQMCDVENKGFITQRDMQVRSLGQGWVLWLSF